MLLCLLFVLAYFKFIHLYDDITRETDSKITQFVVSGFNEHANSHLFD